MKNSIPKIGSFQLDIDCKSTCKCHLASDLEVYCVNIFSRYKISSYGCQHENSIQKESMAKKHVSQVMSERLFKLLSEI